MNSSPSPSFIDRLLMLFYAVAAVAGAALLVSFVRFEELHREYLNINFNIVHGARLLLKSQLEVQQAEAALAAAARAETAEQLRDAEQHLELALSYTGEASEGEGAWQRARQATETLLARVQDMEVRIAAGKGASPGQFAALSQGAGQLATALRNGELDRWGALSSSNVELAERMERLKLLIGGAGTVFALVMCFLAWALVRKGKAERLLRQAKAQVEAIQQTTLDTVPSGVACFGLEDGVIYALNGRFADIFGYRREELLGSSTDRLYPTPEEYARVGAAARPLLERGEIHSEELRLRRKDGELLWCGATGRALDAGQGRTGMIWVIDDVTGRRQMENALRDSEERFRAMAQTVPSFLFTLNAAGECDYMNPRFLEYTGLRERAALGSGWMAAVHPEDLAVVRSTRNDGLRRRCAYSYEARLRGADGVYRWYMLSTHPVLDDAGRVSKWFGSTSEIDNLKKTESLLRLAASALEHAAEGVLISAHGVVVSANRAFTAITGYRPEEIVGRPVTLLHSQEHERAHHKERVAAIRHSGSWEGEIWGRRKDGEIYPAWSSISAVRDEAGRTTHYVSVFSDISVSKENEERLEYLAHHDVLTGLPNRALFHRRLREMLTAGEQRHFAVLFIDLDRFKPINDSLGHEAGDRLLQRVGERLRANVEAGDIVARLGGDEFTVLLDNVARIEEAGIVAQKLLDALAPPFALHGHDLYISASIGVSCHPQDGRTLEVLIKNADAAMYQAKKEGRNAYRFFAAHMNADAAEELFLASGLRAAIEQDELILHYQPQVCLATGRVVGIEALVRWRHPQRGVLPPARFVRLAEESGAIEHLGEWVLRTAGRQMRQWIDAGLADCRIGVNLSARQFGQASLAERLLGILAQTGLPPGRLELEITESMVMQNPERAAAILAELSENDIALAIDDFGTGHSSLAYLRRFPVSHLKIDRSFITGLPGQPGDAELTRAIIAMGKSLNLRVLAEGVESAEQSEFLRQEGCDAAQGFWFARPLEAAAMAEFLRERAGERVSVQ